MNWRVIIRIAIRHLWARKKQSGIAALGVLFGIGAYIILMSFMTGLNGMLDSLILDRTPHVRLYTEMKPSIEQPLDRMLNASEMVVIHSIKPKKDIQRIRNAIPIMSHLEKDRDVLGLTARVQTNVFYLAGANQLNGMLMGIHYDKESELFNFDDYVVRGNASDLPKTSNGILLGAGVADKLSVDVGDVINVRTALNAHQSLKIIGIYQTGMADIDNVQSYINLRQAQSLMGQLQSYVTDIHLKLDDIEKAPAMAHRIEAAYGVDAVDIQTANAQFETGTSIRNLISYAVSFTLLLVAGFGIYNILNMLIYEKMNDIAILRATGFSARDIQAIFVTQAVGIGMVGGWIGLIVGWLVSYLISQTPFDTEALPTIKTFPVNFDPMFYVNGFIFAFISTFVAGYLPAKRAGDLDPVDVLRGQ